MVFQLLRPFGIEAKRRCPVEIFTLPLDLQRVARRRVGGKKFSGDAPRPPELVKFREDDSPAEKRQNQKRADGDLPFRRRLLKSELQRTGGEERGERELSHDELSLLSNP